ncbi:ParB/RepB/Spo0J family partition protein [Streptomyces sp. V1I1]|uniref:ParB/RepB/Spo0J family partition protein n=1 Tax=Streptomyces sp. V1I1 TaxID=3042272 RepID=UPI0027D81951|nr:ParB/RepB/Spo0J family partition protein [Streptomyces sp. V1I1]
MTAETTIEVEHLREAGTPRSSGEDNEHVKALTDVEDRLPPIIVHRPTMRVIDGMHRLRAAKLRGARRIRARYFEGDEADAFVLAVRTNVSHGLPLSLSDRRAAAARIVATHPRWSDRRIAAATGLAARTVASLRQETGVDGTAGGTRRIGQDGEERPVSSAEGRRITGELIAGDPEL